MKLGVVTPVVTRLPRAHATWEETAGIDEIARVAVEAERLGYHHLTCSEHVALPAAVAETRGATYWDPLPTFGYIAARTTTIRLATHVLVLGYHHPLAIAKRYGTLDAPRDRVCRRLGALRSVTRRPRRHDRPSPRHRGMVGTRAGSRCTAV